MIDKESFTKEWLLEVNRRVWCECCQSDTAAFPKHDIDEAVLLWYFKS
jgi:hypothetical protein